MRVEGEAHNNLRKQERRRKSAVYPTTRRLFALHLCTPPVTSERIAVASDMTQDDVPVPSFKAGSTQREHMQQHEHPWNGPSTVDFSSGLAIP